MAHKNWDNVRDHRLYGYMNQKELDQFLEAMRLRDLGQPATAVREFLTEISEQIIITHRQKQFKQQQVVIPTVKYQFPSGKFTVN
ncbi:hypothetical protein [Psychrobacter sp. JB193]|uniref:hypothetical protein n=1 Tax=Psychrobacter sp. JB193 TaxID=2024406 RepID=UPI000BAADF8E|nr:hypothetical protein [Psychrobacter sp. JB193]PAT63123.1 hypothetical protein CIK80_11270 [Psychrobacter sp. JB193]